MITTDPIADLFTRIRNGYLAGLNEVVLPHSRLKQAICQLLVKEGFLAGAETGGKKPALNLNLKLKYVNRRPVLTSLRRISKPGMRRYVDHSHLKSLTKSKGVVILSTSQGIMTAREAKSKKSGGEIIGKAI
jgi:small subunit ribosomal protein S8